MISSDLESVRNDGLAGAFTSRWWGIVSTVYLCTAPFTIAWGYWCFMFYDYWNRNPAPRAPGWFQYFTLALWIFGPLFAGALIATAKERLRRAESPLVGARLWRRRARIAVGLLLPLAFALRELPIIFIRS